MQRVSAAILELLSKCIGYVNRALKRVLLTQASVTKPRTLGMFQVKQVMMGSAKVIQSKGRVVHLKAGRDRPRDACITAATIVRMEKAYSSIEIVVRDEM